MRPDGSAVDHLDVAIMGGGDGVHHSIPHAGVWERVFDALTADRDNQYLMLDSTIVRAHQQAASGKGGARIRRWGVPEVD